MILNLEMDIFPVSVPNYHNVKEESATRLSLDILCVRKLNNRAELSTTKREETLRAQLLHY